MDYLADGICIDGEPEMTRGILVLGKKGNGCSALQRCLELMLSRGVMQGLRQIGVGQRVCSRKDPTRMHLRMRVWVC